MNPFSILIINFVLYTGLLFLLIIKRNKGTLAKIAVFAYAFIAFCSFYFSTKGVYDIRELKLWPFLVYFLVFLLLILPFIKSGSLIDRFTIKNIKRANLLANTYLVCCVFQIVISFSKTISAILGGDYLAIYLSKVDEDIAYYDNFFEQIIINVVNYFFIPMVVYGFYVFAHRVQYRFKWLLLLLPFIAQAMFAIAFASRTNLFNLILVYGSIFCLFRHYFDRSITRRIIIIGVSFGIITIAGSVAITESRFSNDTEGNWVANYFGESFITAHDTFAYTTRYSNGTYFFRNIVKMTGGQIIYTQCAKDHGYGFRPIISTRFSDFGPLGLGFYVFFCFLFFSSLLRKNNLSWGTLAIILYFYKCITLGVLYENNNEISWLYVLITALILDLLTNKQSKYVKNYSLLSSTVSPHNS